MVQARNTQTYPNPTSLSHPTPILPAQYRARPFRSQYSAGKQTECSHAQSERTPCAGLKQFGSLSRAAPAPHGSRSSTATLISIAPWRMAWFALVTESVWKASTAPATRAFATPGSPERSAQYNARETSSVAPALRMESAPTGRLGMARAPVLWATPGWRVI